MYLMLMVAISITLYVSCLLLLLLLLVLLANVIVYKLAKTMLAITCGPNVTNENNNDNRNDYQRKNRDGKNNDHRNTNDTERRSLSKHNTRIFNEILHEDVDRRRTNEELILQGNRLQSIIIIFLFFLFLLSRNGNATRGEGSREHPFKRSVPDARCNGLNSSTVL